MHHGLAIIVLLFAALLEVSGDALVRAGLQNSAPWTRGLLFAMAAAVLFSYGWLVNALQWNFGRLFGLYVVFFFVVTQAVSWLAFGEPPPRAVLIGGALIISGGLVIVTAQA